MAPQGGAGMPPKHLFRWGFLFMFVAAASWYASLSPPEQGLWKPQFAVMPTVRVSGDELRIHNLRDFRYGADGKITDQRYLDQQFRLSELETVWFGLSHFGEHGLAHAFMSFGFSNGQYLAVSIEARQTVEQTHYSPVAGAFRRYTKFMVLATEQDIIGLRSHVRREKVLLYRLAVSPLQSHTLLMNFLRRAQSLSIEPDFYNTLTDNCLTGLMSEAGQYQDLHHWFDYRILLPGYADEMLLQDGLLASAGEIDVVREQARVSAEAGPDDEGFSLRIRGLAVSLDQAAVEIDRSED